MFQLYSLKPVNRLRDEVSIGDNFLVIRLV